MTETDPTRPDALDLDPQERMRCWCGAEGTYEELFDESGIPATCGGDGVVHCECGGDHLCVCHHHGEVECFGCPDCEEQHDEDD